MSQKHDSLDALILLSGDILIEESANKFTSIDETKIKVSPRFHRKMLRRIRRNEGNKPLSPTMKIVRNIDASILIIVAVTFITMMRIDTVRADFWSAIVTWFENHFAIEFTDVKDDEVALIEKREPTWIPGGLEKKVKADSPTVYMVQYLENDVKVLTYTQQTKTDSEIWFNNEDCTLRYIDVSGIDAVLAKYDHDGENLSLYWSDDDYTYILTSYDKKMTEKEFLKIAASIK